MPAFGLPFWVLLNRTGTGEKRRAESEDKDGPTDKERGKDTQRNTQGREN